MSENPSKELLFHASVNGKSLTDETRPAFIVGYTYGHAALQSQLERGPCGVEGHRQSDWVGPFDHHKDCFYNNETGVVECVCEVKNAYCSACRAVQEAVEKDLAEAKCRTR